MNNESTDDTYQATSDMSVSKSHSSRLPNEAYIVTEDPTRFDNDDYIDVVSITELTRNKHQPDKAKRVAVKKAELILIAEDLQAYTDLLNSQFR